MTDKIHVDELLDDSRITIAELQGLFGPMVPMEAACLLFHEANGMPIEQVRHQLREIADKNKPIPDITLTLPRHAVRFLAVMLKDKRHEMARSAGGSLQDIAAFDSLNELECAIPGEFWSGVRDMAKEETSHVTPEVARLGTGAIKL